MLEKLCFKAKNRPTKIKQFLWAGLSASVLFLIIVATILILITHGIRIPDYSIMSVIILLPFIAICSFVSYFYSNTGTLTFAVCFFETIMGLLSIGNLNLSVYSLWRYIISATIILALTVASIGMLGKSEWNKQVSNLLDGDSKE